VASERLDALIAAVFHLSRSQCLELFRSGKIVVGGRLYENNSGQPKAGELISVRGYGRFLYDGIQAETKK
jgi:RNA-binding protein YlmH